MNAQNHALSTRWFTEVWNERSDDAVAEVICPNCIGHTESGDLTGAEAFKQLRDGFLAALPDLKMVVEDIVSDGDDVVVRWSAIGTHTGDGLGLEPTLLSVHVRGMTWQRYKDGKMIEAWDGWNQEALMNRLREGLDDHRERTPDLRRELAGRLREIRRDFVGDEGGPEMARRLNLPSRTYYHYETGVPIPAEVLLQIIDITGVRPSWLLRGDEPRYEVGKGPTA